jgi:ATP-dependent Clp protease adapter protein ClpS
MTTTARSSFPLLLIVALVCSFTTLLAGTTTAFAPPQVQPSSMFGVSSWRQTPTTHLKAGQRDSDSGGGAALAKPAVKTEIVTKQASKQKQKQAQKAKTHDPISRREEDFEEAPMYKLMLLGDEGYDAAHVVERMCAIVEDMDEDQASTVLQQSLQEGKAMCGKYPMEIAELYKEQLIRSDPMIFSDLEEENQ